MSTFDGAVITEQGITFAIVCVHYNVVDNPFENDKAINSFQPIFPGLPIILSGQGFGENRFYGRDDIVRFLINTNDIINRIPWRTYTI